MELRRSFDIKKCFLCLYFIALLLYIIVGFMPAGATDYKISANIRIPSINLSSDVTELQRDGRKLHTPETIVGSYTEAENKILLIGHSVTVFENLDQLVIGDEIWYDGREYRIEDITVPKKEQINMNKVLKSEETDTLVLMTCAGEDLGAGDATHRLILTAKAV